MLADTGYDTEEIKKHLKDDGYIFYVGKNLRRTKLDSYDVKPLSGKHHKIYNQRIGIENLNS